jgi:hypothetical protein
MWFSAGNTIDWPGGWAYGARLLSDTLPFVAVLLAPVFAAVARTPQTWSPTAAVLAGVLLVSFCWAAFANGRGALSWSTQKWNSTPVAADYDVEPNRYWQWTDPPFLRGGKTGLRDLYGSDEPAPISAAQACVNT